MSEPTMANALIGLLWLASPALPVGGFSYSEGLEAAVDAGLVRDEASALRFVADAAALNLARGELPLVAAAQRAWAAGDDDGGTTARACNDWVLATRESAELRQQTMQMGRSLAGWLRQRHGGDARVAWLGAFAPAPTWPVGFALAAQLAGAAPRDTLLAFGFGWAENLVQAAVKAVPLGQSAGQRLLGALADQLPAHADAALARPDDARQCFAPGLAVLSARHETQYSRLFRS